MSSAFLQKIKQEPTTYLFFVLWKYSEGQRLKLASGVLLLVISYGSGALSPLVLALILNEIQINSVTSENMSLLLLYASLLIVIAVVFSLSNIAGNYLKDVSQYIARINYRNYLLDGILDLPLSWQNNKDSGDLIDKVNKGIQAFKSFGNNFDRIISILVNFISALIALIYFEVTAGIIIFFALIFIGSIVLRFDARIIPIQKRLNKNGNRVSAKTIDILTNIQSVLILNVQTPLKKGVDTTMRSVVSIFGKMVTLIEVKWGIANILFNIFVIFGTLALYIYGKVDSAEVIQIGSISALFLYLNRMDGAFHGIMMFYSFLITLKTDMLNTKEIEDDFISQKSEKKSISLHKYLDLQNVSFSYENNETGVSTLDKVSLSIIQGEKIACIGESGSGKTTFLGLLHGLYGNDSGAITIDGKKVDESFDELDLNTMLVPQEPELFSASVRENITFGMEYEDSKIREMLDTTKFSKVLDELPNGLDSVINEKGVNLSGGQKQRLALARALLFAQDKEIILLDESTSSVDPENEIKIYKNIFKEFEGKTILASIHKMNLLKYFDRIVMFEKGKIVDEGNFDELLNKNDSFRNMWEDYVKTH